MPVGIGTSQAASQRVSLALPAAAANATSNALNLTPQGGRGQGSLKLQVSVPAQATLADTKNITFDILDCDTEGGAYTPVEGYGNIKVTGAAAAGAAAKSFLLRLHDHVRQFVKLKATTDAASGAITGSAVFETIFQG
jgi:hypothetical protein